MRDPEGSRPEPSAGRPRRDPSWAWAAILLAGLAALVGSQRGLLDLPHLGFDTYPFLASARVDDAADVARILGEEAMGGRYPAGDFYRPVTTLSFALDRWLWGTAARGFHRTDLAILGASGALFFLLARRLLGGLAGPAAALAIFALHTAHLSTVPVSARRVETLLVLFTLAALAAVARPLATPAARRAAAWLAAVAALLAVGAKETGALVPILVALLAWSRDERRTGAARRALALALPAFAVVAAFLVLRQVVLGGLGGHLESSPRGVLGAPAALADLLAGLIVAQPPGAALAPSAAWPLLGAALLAVAAVPLSVGRAADERRADGRMLAFLGAWLFALAFLSALAGRVYPWHVASGVPIYALAVGLCARRLGAAVAERGWRTAHVAASAALALLLALELAISPLARSYGEWEFLGRATEDALARVDRAVREVPRGATRDLGPIPQTLVRASRGPGIEATGLEPYTLRSYIEVAHPAASDVVLVPLPAGLELQAVPDRRVLGVRPSALHRPPAER